MNEIFLLNSRMLFYPTKKGLISQFCGTNGRKIPSIASSILVWE